MRNRGTVPVQAQSWWFWGPGGQQVVEVVEGQQRSYGVSTQIGEEELFRQALGQGLSSHDVAQCPGEQVAGVGHGAVSFPQVFGLCRVDRPARGAGRTERASQMKSELESVPSLSPPAVMSREVTSARSSTSTSMGSIPTLLSVCSSSCAGAFPLGQRGGSPVLWAAKACASAANAMARLTARGPCPTPRS